MKMPLKPESGGAFEGPKLKGKVLWVIYFVHSLVPSRPPQTRWRRLADHQAGRHGLPRYAVQPADA